MKILVTGANGYLGRGIVSDLAGTDNNIIAVDFSIEKKIEGVAYKECNLFDIEKPYSYFDEPDALLHLAWRDGFVHYSEAHILDLPKHYRFIESMAKSGIKKIAVMGSMHEIGFYEGSINETTPCNPVTPYGISKNALRGLTKMLCEQNEVLFQWLRGFYIVGGNTNGNSLFSKIALAEEKGEKKFPFTQGMNQFDFIDYPDFCRLTGKVVCQDNVLGVINICSGRPEKLSDRAERFIQENHYDIRLDYGAFPDRPYDSKAVWGDNSKIRKIMGEIG